METDKKQILISEINLNEIKNIDKAIDIYAQLRKTPDNTTEDYFDHEAHILKTVSCLLDRKSLVHFDSNESSIEYESNDSWSTRTETIHHIYISATDINGQSMDNFRNGELSEKTITEINHSSFSDFFDMNINQRICLAKILIENQIKLELPDYSDNIKLERLPIIKKQYDVLSKAFDIAKNIDFESVSKSIIDFNSKLIEDFASFNETIDHEINLCDNTFPDPNIEDRFYRVQELDNFKFYYKKFLTNNCSNTLESIHPDELTQLQMAILPKKRDEMISILSNESENYVEEFNSPPLPFHNRAVARVSKQEDGNFIIDIDGVKAKKWLIKKNVGEFVPHKIFENEIDKTFTINNIDPNTIKHHLPAIELDQEQALLTEGEYGAEFVKVEKNDYKNWRLKLLSPKFLENEKKEILKKIKDNLPLRKLAVPIDEEGKLYGMPIYTDKKPVYKDGKVCNLEDASYWVMYMAEHSWPNSYPDAFILSPMKGFRSKSTGKTLEQLKKEFFRP